MASVISCLVFGHSYLPVKIGELEVEEPTRETTKAQVGAEAGGTGQQGVGVHSRPLKVCHPRLGEKKQH